MTEEAKSENVLILGASTNPSRYSHMATVALCEKGHSVFPVGVKKGEIRGHEIESEFPENQPIDTITLYLNPSRQLEYYDRILESGTKRIIFNPGTENVELADMAIRKGIKPEMACTLVMLSVGTF